LYHLTCPSCHDVTDSPFVRSGAVVRCPACDNKYRIKSSHFEREVHTGPRTVDETDTVLRSDSVDIDPDEMPPVSIDDDGNVVGLSGLSELMRWSDKSGTDPATDVSSAVPGRGGKSADAALPAAKTASNQEAPTVGSGRARAQALKRKKRNKMYLMMGSGGAVLIVAVLLIVQIVGGGASEVAEQDPKPDSTTEDTPEVVDTADPDPEDPPEGPADPQNPELFADPDQPEPNPDSQFVAPWLDKNRADPPVDVPTMLTPARPLVHEGWYIMNPPRGSADAAGVSNVELGKLVATDLSDGITLLSSTITNSSSRMVMRGELHLMLLDSTGNVYAETYVPLAMIDPRSRHPFAMTIPTRYWKRMRGTRSSVLVQDWAEPVEEMQDVRVEPAGQGPSAALRVSVKNKTGQSLRRVTIYVSAIGADGKALASFLVEEENLYIRENRWLDLVLATPLHPDQRAADWSVKVVPR